MLVGTQHLSSVTAVAHAVYIEEKGWKRMTGVRMAEAILSVPLTIDEGSLVLYGRGKVAMM
jgi:hypothetical protein